MKKILALLMAALLAVSLCSCKESNNEKAEGRGKTVDATEISIYSYKPDTLCPIFSKNEANVQMLGIVYEGLVSLSDSLYPDPQLAESWSVSEDGMRWTVSLRQNVVWHDGSGFSADDVIYTVNQIKANSDSPYFYNVSYIKNVTAKGDSALEFELEKPWANFVNLLYFPVIKKVQGGISADDFRPVGTGPYMLEDRNEGNVFYLVRNDQWWGEPPETKSITINLLPDNDTALYAFSSGSIDMTTAEDMNWGRFVDPVSSSYMSMPTPIFHFIGINHTNEVLSCPEVRRSISFAINRDEIIEEVMTGYATAAIMPIHPKWFVCGEKTFETNQNNNAAKKEMQENGWELQSGLYRKTLEEKTLSADFTILYNEENERREGIAPLIEKALEEQGISVSLEKVSFEEYQERIAEGDFDAFLGSYIVSPDMDFSVIIAEDNVFSFEDDEMKNAVRSIGTKYSISGIEEGYGAVIDKFQSTMPVVGLFFEDKVMVYNNRIKGEITPSYFDIYRGIETLRKEETK